jgi:predicted DNA-binding protein (UPF0251 family)/predicted Fe-Mo cluster-binding NifX family protein
MARPTKCRSVETIPGVDVFKPGGVPMDQLNEVQLTLEGFNALRLIDIDGLHQTEAAVRMAVSRQTFGRILAAARRAVSSAVVEGRALRIEGGNYVVRDRIPSPPPASAMATEKPVKERRIAVSSLEPGLDAPVDPRFGRAAGFVIIDLDTMEHEFFDNPSARDMAHGAGTQTADTIIGTGAEVVLTGFVGPKAFRVLHDAGIRAAQSMSGLTVREALARFRTGDVEMTDPDE